MTNEEFRQIIKCQGLWAEQYALHQAIRKQYKLLIMSRHKSRGNKSNQYIQQKLKELSY